MPTASDPRQATTPPRPPGIAWIGRRSWRSIMQKSWPWHGAGSVNGLNDSGCRSVVNAELQSFLAGSILEQPGGRHVNACAGIFDQGDIEARPAQIASSEKAADVRRQPTDHHGGNRSE